MTGTAAPVFDTAVIFEQTREGLVTMDNMTVPANSIRVNGYPFTDPTLKDPSGNAFVHPVSFEVEGEEYRYYFAVWHDYAEISVYAPGDAVQRVSTLIPRNQDELLRAIETVAADYELLDDRLHAALSDFFDLTEEIFAELHPPVERVYGF